MVQENIEIPFSLLFSGIESLELIPNTAIDTSQTYAQKQTAMKEIAEQTQKCTLCSRHQSRSHTVIGAGNTQSPFFLVLSTPDKEEDSLGIPAQGASGDLLEKMLLAIDWSRNSIFITHILKCRSGDFPQPGDIDLCEKYLRKQIEIVAPKIIVAMGDVAAQTLSRTEANLAHLRGKWSSYQNIPTISTWHPSQLLASPEKKKEAWEDLKKIKFFFENN